MYLSENCNIYANSDKTIQYIGKRYYGGSNYEAECQFSHMCAEECYYLAEQGLIDISSLQLVPINIIAYRAQYGSVSPTNIMGAAIAATTIGTIVAIIFCKLMPDKGKYQDKIF